MSCQDISHDTYPALFAGVTALVVLLVIQDAIGRSIFIRMFTTGVKDTLAHFLLPSPFSAPLFQADSTPVTQFSEEHKRAFGDIEP